MAAIPATNAQADVFLGPVHRSSFSRLHRLDGEGWLQGAVWHFKTGKGGATWHHLTKFGYAISVFRNAKLARGALKDIKLKTRRYRVAHLPALLFQSSDVKESLVFVFFVYHSIEVEAYYEYRGVAPARLAKRLRHIFSRQSSHLAHLARLLRQRRHQKVSQSPSTPTIVLPNTATPVPTATVAASQATATPRPTIPPTATPLPTATSTRFIATATTDQPSYRPNAQAVVIVHVTNGAPVVGATILATFYFPHSIATCSASTDSNGVARCSQPVPDLPNGATVLIDVQVQGRNGESASASTSFTVQRTRV